MSVAQRTKIWPYVTAGVIALGLFAVGPDVIATTQNDERSVLVEVTWAPGATVDVDWAIDGSARAEPISKTGSFTLTRSPWGGTAAVIAHVIRPGKKPPRLRCRISEVRAAGNVVLVQDGGLHSTEFARCEWPLAAGSK